ncbi:MAG: ankyrin repeat domain-containing protein [Pyrinomonadaceae bacterium]
MSKKSFIDSVKVGEACSEEWEKMAGNDRLRFCSHCSKHVNNLSEMTRKEAAKFVRASDGNICIRYIVDPRSQQPMFANPFHQITRRAPGLTAGVMTASMALSTAAYAQTSQQPVSTPVVVTSTQNPVTGDGDVKIESTITQQQIQDLPIQGRDITALGGAMVMVEYTSPLSRAVADEDVEAVRDLLVKGERVNAKEDSYSKITPLFVAVEQGNVDIVELLLNFGAKVNARDKQKQTPLMRLDGESTPELVDLMIRHGAKVNLTDEQGNTALTLAANYAVPEVLQALIDAGADFNAADKEGNTALIRAAGSDRLESVRLLLLAGANVNAKNSDGETALDQTSDDEIKTLLISYGAEVKKDNDTPEIKSEGGPR